MNVITINGVSKPIPELGGGKLSDLVEYLNGSLINETQMISSIRVGGKEMTPELERELASKPISEVESLEVITAHPRELMDETLQTLLGFTELLARVCRGAAKEETRLRFEREFIKVMDGLEVLADSIGSAKRVLGLRDLSVVDELEGRLLELLRVLMTARRGGDENTVRAILAVGLPENLARWREDAIPFLIRSRDC